MAENDLCTGRIWWGQGMLEIDSVPDLSIVVSIILGIDVIIDITSVPAPDLNGEKANVLCRIERSRARFSRH